MVDSPAQVFHDVIIYVQGVGGPEGLKKTLYNHLPWGAKHQDQYHPGGKIIKIGVVTDEYIRDGIINKNKYCGSGATPSRVLHLIHYSGGDRGYGGDPTGAIIAQLMVSVLPPTATAAWRPDSKEPTRVLGKVMVKGSSGGAKAALGTAAYLCENYHVDYLGIHDGGFYPPWAKGSETGYYKYSYKTTFRTEKSYKRCNWYQAFGNEWDHEKHGELEGFENIPVILCMGRPETEGGKERIVKWAHETGVNEGEKGSDKIINDILNKIDMSV